MESKNDATARLVASTVGSIIAEVITLPTDVAKVRLQIQKASASGEVHYKGRLKQVCFRGIELNV